MSCIPGAHEPSMLPQLNALPKQPSLTFSQSGLGWSDKKNPVAAPGLLTTALCRSKRTEKSIASWTISSCGYGSHRGPKNTLLATKSRAIPPWHLIAKRCKKGFFKALRRKLSCERQSLTIQLPSEKVLIKLLTQTTFLEGIWIPRVYSFHLRNFPLVRSTQPCMSMCRSRVGGACFSLSEVSAAFLAGRFLFEYVFFSEHLWTILLGVENHLGPWAGLLTDLGWKKLRTASQLAFFSLHVQLCMLLPAWNMTCSSASWL